MPAKTVRKVDPDLKKRTLEELFGMLGKKMPRNPKHIDRERLLRKVMRHRGKTRYDSKFSKEWVEALKRS
jgi:hypothetical protein